MLFFSRWVPLSAISFLVISTTLNHQKRMPLQSGLRISEGFSSGVLRFSCRAIYISRLRCSPPRKIFFSTNVSRLRRFTGHYYYSLLALAALARVKASVISPQNHCFLCFTFLLQSPSFSFLKQIILSNTLVVLGIIYWPFGEEIIKGIGENFFFEPNHRAVLFRRDVVFCFHSDFL